MVDFNKNVRDGLGRLEGVFTTTSSTVGTSPTKIDDRAAGTDRSHTRKVRLYNTHGSNDLAWTIVDVGASAPTITADGSSTDGTLVRAGDIAEISFGAHQSLYIVGSAASTSYNLLIVDDG